MTLPGFIFGFALLVVRISGVLVFAPFFSGPHIPMRVKAMFCFAIAYLMLPIAASQGGVDVTPAAILGELSVGLLLGLSLTLLQEGVAFAGQLIGMQLGLSLANILDPMSRVETPVVSELFGLMLVLTMFACGLDHTLLAALFRTLAIAPLGHAAMSLQTATAFAAMASGIFFVGLQLAAPVMAATFLVEITVSLLGRMAPSLPVMVVGIPLKTMAGYLVMLGSLALWPRYIAVHWQHLLDHALALLAPGGK